MKFGFEFGSRQRESAERVELKRSVETIEKLQLLHLSDRLSSLLVLAGVKPATFFNYPIESKSNPDLISGPSEYMEAKTDRIIQALQSTGLFVSRAWQHVVVHNPEETELIQNVAVGRTKDEMDHMMDLIMRFFIDKERGTDIHRDIGLAVGFPETAVEAFVVARMAQEKGTNIDSIVFATKDDIPEDIRDQDFWAFQNFKLSKDNWQSEIEVVRQWAAKIKELSPKMYKEVVDRYRNSGQRNRS